MGVVILNRLYSMIFPKKLSFLTVFLLLIAEYQLLTASNNFIPDAPVINFKLPMFGKEGYRSWFLSGNQGIYVNEGEVDVLGMKISIFSDDARDLLEATIESPKAILLIHKNKARGDDWIEVVGESYHLTGKDWTWDGKLKKMSIGKDVKVIFDQSLKGLMTYENK